jgi:hypothetical protein
VGRDSCGRHGGRRCCVPPRICGNWGKSRQRVIHKQTATRLLEVWSTKWKRENKIQHEENVRKNCRGPSLMHKGLLLPVNLHISEGWGLPSAEGQSTAVPQFPQPHGNRIGHRSAFLSSLGAVAKGGQTPAYAGLGGLSSPVCPCLNRKSDYKLQTNVTSFEPVLWTNPIRNIERGTESMLHSRGNATCQSVQEYFFRW